jgi:23S rRNA (guanine2535-N1)-methyltransferase
MEPKISSSQYQFTTNENHQDFSSGRVLYGATGSSNFPVRLISEIFQRAKYLVEQQGVKGPYTIYDPFCGAGYSLTVLGFLHGNYIKNILASDVNKEMLEVAKKNLSLLTKEGLEARKKELQELFTNFNKPSHKEALSSITRLTKLLPKKPINTQVFIHNALQGNIPSQSLLSVDLVITDLPYGKLNQWEGAGKTVNPTQQFLDNLKSLIKPSTLVVISCNKKQEILHKGYTNLKSFKIGIRKILFLRSIITNDN